MTARSALFWSAVDRFFQQGVQFVLSVVLARLIAPEEFGLIAMVVVFIAIGKQVMDGGMRSAIIQRKDLKPSDCTTALMLNLLLGVFLAAMLWFAAPYIAVFYNEPRLELIVRVLCFGLILQSPSVVQTGLLSKALNFKKQTNAAVVSGLISGGIGVYMAYAGYEVWALVVSSLVGTFILSLCLWWFSDWRPSERPSIDSVRRLFPYGSRIAACSLLETVFNNIFPLLIGRFYAPADVAYYQRAFGLKEIPINNLQNTVQRVLFPVLSAKVDEPQAYLDALRRAFHMMACVVFPMMTILFLVAEPLIVLLVGETWLPAAPILQMMCVIGVLYQFVRLNSIVLTTNGLAGLALKFELVKRGFLLLAVCLAVAHGVLAMVLGHVIQTVLALIISGVVTHRIVNYGVFRQIVDIGPYGIIAIVLGYFCAMFLKFSDIAPFVEVAVISAVFGCSYLLSLYIFRLRGLQEILAMVLPKMRSI